MRALLVGINKYPGSPLRGCVNDILATREILMARFGLTSNDIRILLDERATKKNIVERIKWLLSEQMVHDKVLFWFSGHGAYLPNRDPSKDYEYTGNDQLICPVDFDWNGTYILDDDFHALIKDKRPSCQFTAVMDCCHSGTFYRDVHGFAWGAYRKDKAILPPLDIALRDNAYNPKVGHKPILKPRKPTIPGFKMISGCKDTQTSADAYIDGEYRGALSWALQKTWGENPKVNLTDLMRVACDDLAEAGYAQEPQMSVGPGADMSRLI